MWHAQLVFLTKHHLFECLFGGGQIKLLLSFLIPELPSCWIWRSFRRQGVGHIHGQWDRADPVTATDPQDLACGAGEVPGVSGQRDGVDSQWRDGWQGQDGAHVSRHLVRARWVDSLVPLRYSSLTFLPRLYLRFPLLSLSHLFFYISYLFHLRNSAHPSCHYHFRDLQFIFLRLLQCPCLCPVHQCQSYHLI